jgi:hypothetical protein
MALTYGEIGAITTAKYVPVMVDNVFNKNAFLKKLKAQEKPKDGGEKCIQPLNYAKNGVGGWFSGAETLDSSGSDVITAASFEWAQLYQNISITRRDELMNSGDSAKLNFVRNKIEIAEKTIRDDLNTALFNTGTDSKAISGINHFLSTSASYGGIDQSTYSWWQANVDSTTTTLTISAMQSLFGDCGEGSEYPNFLLSDQDMFDRYYNLLQPQQRFVDEEMAKGGFKSLTFNGQPYTVDAAATAGDLYMLNLDYLDLYPHKDENFRMTPFQSPHNQAVKVAKIFLMTVLASSNNRRHGKLDAITA